MKKSKAITPFTLYCFLITVFLLPSFSSFAAVREVTIFPASAKIWETAKIRPQCSGSEKCRAVITIPPLADPESFVASLPAKAGWKIEDIQFNATAVQDEAKIAELRKQIQKLKEEKTELQAKIQALDVQLQFWQAQTKAKTKNLTETDALAAAIGKNVRKSFQEKIFNEVQLEKTDRKLKELQDNLNQAASKKDTAWEVTMTLLGANQNEIVISYNYLLSGCGWLPLYRLEALPGENKISFSWEAEIWQSSGDDWKQAQVNLATLQPAISAAPGELPAWIIKPRPVYSYKASRIMEEKSMRSAAPREALAQLANEDEAPVQSSKTTYSVWSLGKKNILAGVKQRMKIKDELWPADFTYLARPSLSPQVYVRAQVKFAESMEIPEGQSVFLIDGAILNKRGFSLKGTEGILYFGVSPLITVSSTALANKSGEKTIFQDKKTHLWQWLIEAKNASAASIKLFIEEPQPQPRDERIKLTFKHNPEATEKDNAKFVWLMDIPAHQKKSIQTIIELAAPRDMDLDLGWRR